MADAILLNALVMAALAGAGCGLAGVFIYLLNIPFIGVAIAHSAMAGGIWGIILGLPSKLSAYAAALAASLAVGPAADRSKTGANVTLSIIFSFVMGLAFLGVGLMQDKSRLVMNFLWGNILLTGWQEIMQASLVLAALVAVITVFYRQYSAILFNRELAAALGVRDRLLYWLMLAVLGAVVTVNLDTIGGLMLFSIIITPPAIAAQFSRGLKMFFALSAAAGAAGSSAGVAIAFAFNLPVSATVVLFMTALFAAAVMAAGKRA
jgi:manganese/iron transport system permease protein